MFLLVMFRSFIMLFCCSEEGFVIWNFRLVLISLSVESVLHIHFCHACLNLLMDEFAYGSVLVFCQPSCVHHCHVFFFMFGGCSMFISLHLDAYLLQIADRCHILKRSPFPNRSSDSNDLYIVFKRNHLTFPVALLVFKVEASFNHSLSNLAYASHIASRIAYNPCIMLFEFARGWLCPCCLFVFG